jgi:hypothetical protein
MLVILLTILAAVVGPASAILMLPSIDWWEYKYQPNSFSEGQTPGIKNARLFIGSNEPLLWPTQITLSSFPLNCNNKSSPVSNFCPLGGLSTLLDSFPPLFDILDDSSWNITIPTFPSLDEATEQSYNRYLEGTVFLLPTGLPSTGQLNPTNISWALSQTVQDFAAAFLFSINEQEGLGPENEIIRWKLSLSNGSQLLRPVTYVACLDKEYEWRNGSLWQLGLYGSDQDPESTILSQWISPGKHNRTWSTDASELLSVWNNLTESAVVWVEPPELGEDVPSIGIVLAAFSNTTNFDQFSYNYSAEIVTCSVFSNWQPVDIYIDPTTDNLVHSLSTNKPLADVGDPNYLGHTSLKPIKFDLEWANWALPSNETVGQLATTLNPTSDEYTCPLLYFGFEMAVSLLITDAISRIGMLDVEIMTEDFATPYWGNAPESYVLFPMNISALAPGNSTEFHATLLRYGYSYSMDGLTRRLAAGILLTHVFIATVFMICITWFGWSCYGLKSLYEIFVLAINSPSTEKLDNTSAGIAQFDTYKHIIKVGEISDTQSGILFNDSTQGRFHAPVEGKKYGRLHSDSV